MDAHPFFVQSGLLRQQESERLPTGRPRASLNGVATTPPDASPPAPIPALDAPLAPAPQQAGLVDTAVQSPAPADAAIAVPEPAAPEPADAPIAEPGDWDVAPAPENQPQTWALHFGRRFAVDQCRPRSGPP
jgi:hypothetical protein